MKKIAIPTENNSICAHFGHCKEFSIFETEDGQIVSNELAVPPPHEPGVLPGWLAEKGVTDIIAGGMGQRAINLFLDNKINVYVGVTVKAPKELVLDLLNGNLQAGVNLCDH
ncbi:MAG: NifB/NifX family molybdenum-iron cluster-binding protein [Bacteroidales bacterium]|nr:NifB/NifX family molybdenum-iron cluster-binding protein [Bacteroidales bacterium]